MKKTRSRRFFARTAWTVADVNSIRPDWTPAQCLDFLERNEHHIADKMIENGFDILTVLIHYSQLDATAR